MAEFESFASIFVFFSQKLEQRSLSHRWPHLKEAAATNKQQLQQSLDFFHPLHRLKEKPCSDFKDNFF